MNIKTILVFSLGIICLLATSGCGTTRSENGVMIQQQQNLMDYIPFL